MSAIGRNIVWMLFSQIATWAMSIVVLVVAPEQLGSGDFGRLGLAVAYVGFFGLFALLGTYQFLVKTVAREPESLGHYITNAIVLKLCLSVGLAAVAFTLALLLGYDRGSLTLIAIGLVGMVLSSLNDTLVAGLASIQRMARPAAWNAAQVYASGIVGLGVLLLGKGVVAYAWVAALAVLIPVAANLRLLWPYTHAHWRMERHMWRRIAVGGLPFLSLGVFITIYGTIDIPLLEAIAGSESVGLYLVAYKWVGMPIFIATILVSAFLPSLSALASQATDAFTSLANRALRMVFFVAVPASCGLILVASDLVGLLYSDEYSGATVLMRILAIHVPIAAIDVVLATTLIAGDRQRPYVVLAAIVAVINPAANILAINLALRWNRNGAVGSAIVTVVTEMCIMAVSLRLCRPGVMGRTTAWFAMRCVIASSAMAPAIWVCGDGDRTLFVKILAGATAYLVASVALRTLSQSHVRRALDELRRARPTGGRTATLEISEPG